MEIIAVSSFGRPVSLLAHHFFANDDDDGGGIGPMLLLLADGRRRLRRHEGRGESRAGRWTDGRAFLNDVPEYIQFQKFEFGVSSELSIIESREEEGACPRAPFPSRPVARCPCSHTLLVNKVEAMSALLSPKKIIFIFGPSQRVFRKKELRPSPRRLGGGSGR